MLKNRFTSVINTSFVGILIDNKLIIGRIYQEHKRTVIGLNDTVMQIVKHSQFHAMFAFCINSWNNSCVWITKILFQHHRFYRRPASTAVINFKPDSKKSTVFKRKHIKMLVYLYFYTYFLFIIIKKRTVYWTKHRYYSHNSEFRSLKHNPNESMLLYIAIYLFIINNATNSTVFFGQRFEFIVFFSACVHEQLIHIQRKMQQIKK